MKILITGGAGFIGSSLCNYLSSEHVVTIVDDLSMGKKENIQMNNNITFIKGSVTDKKLMEQIVKETKFDYIFHFAAVASVADSVERPVETHQVNFESVLNLLELVRQYNPAIKRLIFSSSAAVYGDEPTLPKEEQSIIKPLTPYAIDKFAAERYVLAYNNLYGISTTAVRFFNVYGPKQNPNSPYSGVISIITNQFARKRAGEEAKFNVFGDGNQSRDFVYIEDVIKALLLVMQSDEAKGEVFNVGTGHATSLNELLSIFESLTSFALPVCYSEARDGDIKHSFANITKLKSLGYYPSYSIGDGIEKYLMSIGLIPN